MTARAIFLLDGTEYRRSGYFGCQLESFEWGVPAHGTMRRILGFDMSVWSVERRLFRRSRICWALSDRGSLDECKTRIEALQNELRKLVS